MARFNAAKMNLAQDQIFERKYNYLIDLLDTGYSVESLINGHVIKIDINPQIGFLCTNDGVETAYIDPTTGNFRVIGIIANDITTGKLSSADGDTYFDLDKPEIVQVLNKDGHELKVVIDPVDGLAVYTDGVKTGGVDLIGNEYTFVVNKLIMPDDQNISTDLFLEYSSDIYSNQITGGVSVSLCFTDTWTGTDLINRAYITNDVYIPTLNSITRSDLIISNVFLSTDGEPAPSEYSGRCGIYIIPDYNPLYSYGSLGTYYEFAGGSLLFCNTAYDENENGRNDVFSMEYDCIYWTHYNEESTIGQKLMLYGFSEDEGVWVESNGDTCGVLIDMNSYREYINIYAADYVSFNMLNVFLDVHTATASFELDVYHSQVLFNEVHVTIDGEQNKLSTTTDFHCDGQINAAAYSVNNIAGISGTYAVLGEDGETIVHLTFTNGLLTEVT